MKDLIKYIKIFEDVIVDSVILDTVKTLDYLLKPASPLTEVFATSNFSLVSLIRNDPVPEDMFETIFGPLQTGLVQCLEKYSNQVDYFKYNKISGTESFSITKYPTGGFAGKKIDYIPFRARSISFHLTLNDNYTGGELSFFDGEFVIPTKKNQVILFPSAFLFPYEILPITSGERWAVENWAH